MLGGGGGEGASSVSEWVSMGGVCESMGQVCGKLAVHPHTLTLLHTTHSLALMHATYVYIIQE